MFQKDQAIPDNGNNATFVQRQAVGTSLDIFDLRCAFVDKCYIGGSAANGLKAHQARAGEQIEKPGIDLSAI